MSHPIMFDEADAALQRIREIALAFPGAAERISHGRPNFFTTKTFCYFGGSERGDHVGARHDRAILIRPDPVDEPALRQDPRFFEPAYLWPAGWLGFDVPAGDVPDADWSEVAELIDASYRVTAPKTLVRELDARAVEGD
ncbi:MmcQ/YjbR family DNA-binding protein [Microbacterium invictum]|uniref:MmcQ/YjbR family DNA-binding protein n=1 Tax=Microbacterium invictum TaxID=515415 RepID=A0ABZ0V8T6_9MICO|nr:MmcQ/YjbR family DNA-binding protein [Microbacterium invictum]WQB69884.1 MmcQ/YjbR family DNA-binding protein [Microbacterium invictum]